MWHQPWNMHFVTKREAGMSSPTWLNAGAHSCHYISSIGSSPPPCPTRQKCWCFNDFLDLPTQKCSFPRREGWQGKGRELCSSSFTAPETPRKKKLLVSGDGTLSSHCSRATPFPKLCLGNSWTKPFPSLQECKERQKPMGLFYSMQQPYAKANLLCLGL